MIEERAFPARAEAALKSFVRLIEDLTHIAQSEPIADVLTAILEKSGYGETLKADNSPEAESRLSNIEELVNAAAEATERGETISDFLDHAALVADADQVDEQAPVSLLTVHNAKGLEFSNVFLAGMEENLFPHSRSIGSDAGMEEERRLCYVGMTRAEKRLYLTWARYRRRFGGGQAEATIPSRFLKEVPPSLCERLSPYKELQAEEVELLTEQDDVRTSVKKNLYNGRTYNSLDNIAQFFAERGMPVPSGIERAQSAPRPRAAGPSTPPPSPAPSRSAAPSGAAPTRPPASQPPARPVQQSFLSHPPSRPATPPRPPAPRQIAKVRGGGVSTGSTVQHPKYGRGVVLRREGEGEDAKLTISFPGVGLKKIVEKFAGFKVEE
jgi:DNA helicase-2/ATP-dependent DNA helicase PcrA